MREVRAVGAPVPTTLLSTLLTDFYQNQWRFGFLTISSSLSLNRPNFTFRSNAAAASGDLTSAVNGGGPFVDQFTGAAPWYGGQYGGPAYGGAGRYQPPQLQPPVQPPPATYTPLVNHTYALAASAAAAAATAASSASSPSAQTAQVLLHENNDDASSQRSGRSSKSAKEAADQLIAAADIKEDPEAAAFR